MAVPDLGRDRIRLTDGLAGFRVPFGGPECVCKPGYKTRSTKVEHDVEISLELGSESEPHERRGCADQADLSPEEIQPVGADRSRNRIDARPRMVSFDPMIARKQEMTPSVQSILAQLPRNVPVKRVPRHDRMPCLLGAPSSAVDRCSIPAFRQTRRLRGPLRGASDLSRRRSVG